MTHAISKPEKTLLRFEQVSKHYGSRKILSGLNIEIKSGQVYVLTGENGSGKSTLLRVLSGLVAPDSGTVAFLQEFEALENSITKHQAILRKKVMYLHQSPYLFDGSVAKNLTYALPSGLNAKRRTAKIVDALKWSGLESLAANPAKLLSGGEKQRVALARAWLRQAEVLLLDEPTSNLDQASRLKTIALLKELKESGVSMILACHETEEFIGLADYFLNLSNGKLQIV